MVRFWPMVERLSADPEASLTDIFTVARGQVADQYIQNINQYRAKGLHQVGSVSVEDLAAKRQAKRNRRPKRNLQFRRIRGSVLTSPV